MWCIENKVRKEEREREKKKVWTTSKRKLPLFSVHLSIYRCIFLSFILPLFFFLSCYILLESSKLKLSNFRDRRDKCRKSHAIHHVITSRISMKHLDGARVVTNHSFCGTILAMPHESHLLYFPPIISRFFGDF